MAFAARKILQGSEPRTAANETRGSREAEAAREASFRALKKMVEHQAIDRGRLIEFIFEQLALFSADDADIDAEVLNFTDNPECVPENLRVTCRRSNHIFQSPDYPENQYLNLTQSETASTAQGPSSDLRIEDYRAMTVASYLKKMFGSETFDKCAPMLSNSVLNGIVNVSHFVQLERADPADFRNVCRVEARKMDPIIDRALLNCGMMRFCGFVMPPNYYGIDFIVPFLMEDSEGHFSRPIYSFIAFQSKATRATVHAVAYKMAASEHLVRCPITAHVDESCCVSKQCTAFFTAEEMEFICKNQVTVLLSAKNDQQTESARTTVSLRESRFNNSYQAIDIDTVQNSLTPQNFELMEELSEERIQTNIETLIITRNGLIMRQYQNLIGKEIPYENATYAVYPKFDSRIDAPDYIITHYLNVQTTLQQMMWNLPTKKSLLCIAGQDLGCFQHLVGATGLAVLRELANLDSSNLHSVESIHRPIVQDSLLNGIFSPYSELNPLLRGIRGLNSVRDPLENYHNTIFTAVTWSESVKLAAVGPLEDEIGRNLSAFHLNAVDLRAREEERVTELQARNITGGHN